MPAPKLNEDQKAELRELVADMRRRGGASFSEITEVWNDSHPPEFHLTRQAVCYHMGRMRRESLANAADDVTVLTARTLRTLDAIANGDPRALLSWSENGAKLRDSDDLTEEEAALIASITFRGKPGEPGAEVSVTTNSRVQAARALLAHLHGSKLSVTETGAIVRRLTESGDREGLQRIAAGEDPVRVLVDRAPFLRLPDDEVSDDPP